MMPQQELSDDIRALLAARLRERSATPQSPAPRIDRSPRPADVPVSFPQQSVWFAHQLSPDPSAFNTASAFRLRGNLCIDVLESSLQEIAQRHEILRTDFAMRDGQPVQRIRRSGSPPLARRRVDPAEPMHPLIINEIAKPFELDKGPLYRVALFEIAEEDHIFLFVAHHILCDGWSMAVFLRELGELYAAGIEGRAAALRSLEIQYADYALWQRNAVHSAAGAAGVEYWLEQLAGAPDQLDLGGTRRELPEYGRLCWTFSISADLAGRVRELGRRNRATPFMVLLAVWNILLYRYTNQSDMVIGTPSSGRFEPNLENLIGLFLNVLPLRTVVGDHMRFDELLQQIRKTCLGAYAHQEVPFDRIVEALRPVRTADTAPVVQVLFSFQEQGPKTLELPGVTVEEVNVPQGGFDELSLTMVENEGGEWQGWIHSGGRCDSGFLSRAGGYVSRLLEQVCDDPAEYVSQYSLASEEEKQFLLASGHGISDRSGGSLCVHQIIQEQAARTPYSVALRFRDRAITYKALEVKSNQLARHLQSLGIVPGMRVGLFLDRSPKLLIALLATLKAGAAYVPLDPDFPKDRIEYLVGDSQLSLILSTSELVCRLPETRPPLAILNRSDADIANWRGDTLERIAEDSDVAYLIYTSGSTGGPKGVMISNASLANCLLSLQHELKLTAGEQLLSVSTPSFDLATLELLLPLITRATIILADSDTAADGAALAKLIRDSRPQMMEATPSTWKMLLEAGWRPHAGMRLLCGGEALTADLAARLSGPGVRIFNLYGPTETTIWTTVREIHSTASESSLHGMPIGKAIANTQCYVLSQGGQLAPVGVPGELHIAGEGLAYGYFGQPRLTAEKFIPNCFSDRPGERLYRTGDIVRWLPDGDLEFLGRRDLQVKVRGHRIEISEVEAALAKHPAVSEVAVGVRTNGNGDQALVAYLVGRGEVAQPEIATLRAFASAVLPDYMRPSTWIWLERMPLTPTRKLDRKALAHTELIPASTSDVPRSSTEIRLAEIWQELLGRQAIGLNNNFFDIGGHSLAAARLVSRIQEVFDVVLPVRTIFERNTLADLAEAVVDFSCASRGSAPILLLEPIGKVSESESDLYLRQVQEAAALE